MPVSHKFKNRIKELVEDLDYKKTELPAIIGVDNAILSKAMNYGIVPRLRTLIKIADYFNISLEYLLGITENDYFVASENPKLFQDRLEELRESTKLTYYELGRKLLIDRSYFTDWRKENYIPSLEYLEILADYFKVSIDYLLGRTDDKQI